MNTTIITRRTTWQGMVEVFAFNRHWYVAGGIVIAGAATALLFVPFPNVAKISGWSAVVIALFWSAASLLVSHWVYDRSRLCQWNWIHQTLANPPRTWCLIHCGLDESSATVRQLFPAATSTVLDIFDPTVMTEPSIARAHSLHTCDAALASFRKLPMADGAFDAVFLLFAAHELREREARIALFAEVCRLLSEDGEVIVAEHLRDGANFCAFGPGAFHFFSRREWGRVFDAAQLRVHREFAITPFVRVFVLRN